MRLKITRTAPSLVPLPVRFFLSIFCFLSGVATAQNSLPAVGAWREHLPYSSAIAVAATDTKIFCATPYSVFSVSPESGETQRFSKVSGLSETGISTLAYDAGLKKLVIAYSNSNIDVLGENGITNIPDLIRESTTGDKTIYQVYPTASECYLATGLGVVVLNLEKWEVKDTWRIGEGGSQTKVVAIAKSDSFIYAATDAGLKKLPAGADGADFHAWRTISTTLPCSTIPCLKSNMGF
jgi:hypothetical protein